MLSASLSLLIAPTFPLEILLPHSMCLWWPVNHPKQEMATWLKLRANLTPFQGTCTLSRALNENGTESFQSTRFKRHSWLAIPRCYSCHSYSSWSWQMIPFSPWFSKLYNTLPNTLFSLHQPETASVSPTNIHRTDATIKALGTTGSEYLPDQEAYH